MLFNAQRGRFANQTIKAVMKINKWLMDTSNIKTQFSA